MENGQESHNSKPVVEHLKEAKKDWFNYWMTRISIKLNLSMWSALK